ncbi:MAG: type II toxin-antitoxin system RelE/ParE family toxin [Acidobacteria bacterium]|nr:type II toxin-antitoxin system RelE/ParE family toxin [Acidobacteriota bacterium]
MTPLLWSPQSLRDLENIRAYIAKDSPLYADLVIRRLVVAVERLSNFPESGRMVPERSSPEIREVIVKPYRIVYRVREGTVEIVTIFRASRLFPDFV